MHLIGVRRELAEQHPWLPAAVLKAFERSKAIALEKLADTSSTKVALPFVEEMLRDARAFMGEDFWSYGVEPNRKVLDYFLASIARRVFPRGGLPSRSCFTRRLTRRSRCD
jgi:4,5-dihydroxyphthalate decarboxylase